MIPQQCCYGFWVAIENVDRLFSCAIGDTLDELHEQIRADIHETIESLNDYED